MKKKAPKQSLDRVIDRLDQIDSAFVAIHTDMAHLERLGTLGFLTSGIIHEINNLLTPIIAGVQLALSDPDNQDLQKKTLERTLRGAQDASRIADAILGFASPGAEVSEANIAECVQNALDCIARDLNQDGINLQLSLPAETRVNISPLSLQQVLVNLLLNARNALRNVPDAALSISSEPGKGSKEVIIRVIDNGPGIPEAELTNIFQPFVSTKGGVKTSAASPGGAGLGLALCKHLINEAGGSIEASVRPEGGTAFTITLPAAG